MEVMARIYIWKILLVAGLIYCEATEETNPHVSDDQVRLAVSDIREAHRAVKFLQDQLTNVIGQPEEVLKGAVSQAISQLIRLELPLERALSRLNAAFEYPPVNASFVCNRNECNDEKPIIMPIPVKGTYAWHIQKYNLILDTGLKCNGCYYRPGALSWSESTELDGKEGLLDVLQKLDLVSVDDFRPGKIILTDNIVVASVNKKQLVYSKVQGDNGLLLNPVTVEFNETQVSCSVEGSKPVQWEVLRPKQSSPVPSQASQRVEL